MERKDAFKFIVVRSLGNFLLLFSIYGVIATFGPALVQEVQYQIIKFRGVEFSLAEAEDLPQRGFADVLRDADGEVQALAQQSPGFAEIAVGNTEQIIRPPDTDFSLVIPAIGASTKVFPNVDPTNEQEFLPFLQSGIAHAKGSVFPGFQGNVYLFAHSTDSWWNVGRYNAVFYLLKNLTAGDDIHVFFEGARHDYKVDKLLIVDPRDTSFIAREQRGNEQLVLQTCWPPGTTWKRLLVLAIPK